mmetsp:Transcript_560/g.1494  ORF Transcript_560/g.1494 Transcript_560/m.1494 type:complete len:203 (+) Transcript_560:871-1479(+)
MPMFIRMSSRRRAQSRRSRPQARSGLGHSRSTGFWATSPRHRGRRSPKERSTSIRTPSRQCHRNCRSPEQAPLTAICFLPRKASALQKKRVLRVKRPCSPVGCWRLLMHATCLEGPRRRPFFCRRCGRRSSRRAACSSAYRAASSSARRLSLRRSPLLWYSRLGSMMTRRARGGFAWCGSWSAPGMCRRSSSTMCLASPTSC